MEYLEKLQYECDEYKLYSPDSLKYITDNIDIILKEKIKQYKKLFKLDNLEPIQINYFDDIDKFRNYIYSIRGDKKSLPEYAQGTYDNYMVNAFIDSNIIKDSPKYNKKIYMANHEIFHILYLKYILKEDYSKRIVWYDEGMAQFFSGENDILLDEEKFKNFYSKVREETKIIPNLNEIEHGKSFYNENYNGYNLSYLCVRYLNEILNQEEFQNLMSNFDKIKEYGNTIIKDAFDYYESKERLL